MLSGGTAVNYSQWTRGHRADYDEWAKLVGDQRWNYENMLPYFKKTETHYDRNLNPNQHGFSGPIKLVCETKKFKLREPVKSAFEEIGFKYNPDMNSGDPSGIA